MTDTLTPAELRRVAFTVYGKPVPMARPRVCRLPNGKSRTFNPASSTDWKESIALQALAHRPDKLLDGPLILTAAFYLMKPPSKPKKCVHPATKPDWDNLAKAVTDALEGIIYTNDSRIVEAWIVKRYGDPPRVEITVTAIEAVRRMMKEDGDATTR